MGDSASFPIRDRLAHLLEAGDLAGAWRLLEPYADRLTHEREIALAWLEMLEATPDRPELVERAESVLRTWPRDPQVVTAACAALLAAAQRRAPDEPPLQGGPARLAAEASASCLEALDDQSVDAAVVGYLWINRANALRLCRGDPGQAHEAYERALAIEPDKGWWWFDRGLFHKGRGQWQAALDDILRARARVGERKPVLWNLAICATALGQGDLAAATWRRLGLPADCNEHSSMPQVSALPPVQVRVPARGTGVGSTGARIPEHAASFELVWVAPLSPCHGVVQTPTCRQAPVDYGDVILWDGAPVGLAGDGERRVPRFPLLARLREGDERRFPFVAMQHAPGEVERIAGDLQRETIVYVHDERIEWLCALCASGDVMRKHEHTEPEGHRVVYGKIVVPASVSLKAFRDTLERAVRARGTVALSVPGLYEALGDTKKAGQQHQVWRGIERSADKRRERSSPARTGNRQRTDR